ncbi:MAG: glycosyltransferase family 4 protein [Ruminococcaceae bacterium]|nr:glycosyltransferase family 4 protein [Oscillospiraceae bacterium]
MKVLLVNKFHYKKGGSETYYFTVAEALRRRGHEVVFFAMEDEKNLPCQQDKYFVSKAAVSGGIKNKLNMVLHIAYSKEAYQKMKALLGEEKPDLVILNLVHKQISLSIIDAIREYDKKLPIFWTMHDLIAICPAYTMLDGKGQICEKCRDGNFKPCVENRCIRGSRLMSMLSKYEADYIRKRKWYDEVDLYICPSEFYRKKLTCAGFTKSPIVTMRNPLPLDTVYEENPGGDYVLYFGRLAQEKGVKQLLDAAALAGCRLVVLGTGPAEDELKACAKDMPNVEFKGFQTGKALEDFVKNSRCVVLPSQWYENGPYSAMEAMAAGKPLIVSANGGLPELVDEGENGYVYRGGAEALAMCIRKMMALSEEDYGQMSRSAVEKARALFDPEGYVLALEEAFEKATV